MRINYKSDFDFLLRLETADGVVAGWPSHDWRGVFRTSDPSRVFEASCIGGVCVNCREDDGQIHIVADGHGLGPGQLWCEYEEMIPDPTYPDGVRREVTPCRLDIQLVPGASDAGPAVGVVPVSGTAYVLDELASLRTEMTTGYAEKSEVETALDTKQDKLTVSDDLAISDNELSLTDMAKMRLFIDQWNVLCGSFGKYDPDNAPDAEHPFYLNYIWLTYKEALQCVRAYTVGIYQDEALAHIQPKTNIPAVHSWSGSYRRFAQSSKNLLSAHVSHVQGVSSPLLQAFYNCVNLRYCYIGASQAASNTFDAGVFYNCGNLETLEIRSLNQSLNIQYSPLVSLESFKYIIANKWPATTSAITITVHPEVYAKITDEDNTEWHALIELAAIKNISFATV